MSDMDGPTQRRTPRASAEDAHARAPGTEDDRGEPWGHDEAGEPYADCEDSALLRRLRAQVNEENRMRRSVRWAP
ncbi:hypothetical protein [Streptomyces sp. WMMC1477]|uniref:hypothetical protein n=1 Tax=Streptomyces sp. WMMC1477 TaxID=3015155 RepID=UPI0022B62AD1|nr:hypothetical protein [Streptomyces sp. WMMC1477]MCZ7431545.1 hypothetical protein [Streptomyces sp. WMMC1477]